MYTLYMVNNVLSAIDRIKQFCTYNSEIKIKNWIIDFWPKYKIVAWSIQNNLQYKTNLNYIKYYFYLYK